MDEIFSISDYSVVLFVDENLIEGVPTSWLIESKKETFCSWPPGGDIGRMIKNKISPSRTWKQVKCIVKGRAQTFDEMVSLRHEAAIVTTGISDNERGEQLEKENHASPELKKKNSRKYQRRISSSEESSEDLPTPPRKSMKKNDSGKSKFSYPPSLVGNLIPFLSFS